MKREEYIQTFLEGAELAPRNELVFDLVGKLYDERNAKYRFAEKIEFMNDVARECGWSMTCRSCGKSYQPDCELSEMFEGENYCGGNQWCTP